MTETAGSDTEARQLQQLTEARHLEQRTTAELLGILHAADRQAVEAVGAAAPGIERAVEALVDGWQRGGRLIYVGAGSSGRLGVLDAAECPPTFGVPADRVVALLAGGRAAMSSAVEAAEDDERAGRRAVDELRVGARDVVVGLSASGTTPYTCAALETAAARGATTVAVTCGRQTRLAAAATIPIVAEVGAEVVDGSSRMKAGTAQKLVCNAITTAAFIRLGRVVDRYMVAVQTGSAKLRRRALAIVERLGGCSASEAEELLRRAGGDLPVALLMAQGAGDPEAARRRLREAGGDLCRALGRVDPRR